MTYRQRQLRRRKRRPHYRNPFLLVLALILSTAALAANAAVGWVIAPPASADNDEREPIDKGESSVI
jgi:hypothetical protein